MRRRPISETELSRRHGDDFIDDLIEQARDLKLPPPSVTPGFLLARVGRQREQRRSFAAGFLGAAAVVLLAIPLVRNHQGEVSADAEPVRPALPSSHAQHDESGDRRPAIEKRDPSETTKETCPVDRSAPPELPAPEPHGAQAETRASATVHAPKVRWTSLLAKAQAAQQLGQCKKMSELANEARKAGARDDDLKGLDQCTNSNSKSRPSDPRDLLFGGRK